MIELNVRQQAMLSLVKDATRSALESVRIAAFAHADQQLNGELSKEYALGRMEYEEFLCRVEKPTPRQLKEAFNTVNVDFETVRDSHTIGFHLPQRSGMSILAQYLINEYVEENLGAEHDDEQGDFPRALYIGPSTPELEVFPNLRHDSCVRWHDVQNSADYGRVLSRLQSDNHRGTNPAKYSLIIVDCANWIAFNDPRFEKLLKLVHDPLIRPLQFLIHFSS